jgi:hypothetical protein
LASYEVAGIGPPTGSGIVTLSGTTADTITVSPLSRWWLIEIVNLGSTNIDFRGDGVTAQAGAPGTVRVMPGNGVTFRAHSLPTGEMSVVGDDGTYAVNVIPL